MGTLLSEQTSAQALEDGKIRLGIRGSINSLHPYLGNPSQTSDALIYSSLVQYSPEGKLEMDLARDFQIKKDGREFIFDLKRGVTWHDGNKFTAEDVIYTINKILNRKTKSPFKVNWKGVEVEKINSYKIKFTLPNPYPSFIINTTVPILPSHKEFSSHHQNPIGTGPYKLKKIKTNKHGQIQEIILTKNQQFYQSEPRLSSIKLDYSPQSVVLETKFKNGKIDTFKKTPPPKSYKKFSAQLEKATTPKYFALFFNQKKKKILAERSLRKGLALATNKKEIIKNIFSNAAHSISYPVPQTIIDNNLPQIEYNSEKAEKLLAPYKNKTITILAPRTPHLQTTAKMIKNQWEQFRINVKVKIKSAQKLLQNQIKSRNYEALLFGQMLSFEPDPFSFWHSSQSQYPGANLSLYQNKEVDKILEQIRSEMELQKRLDLYKKLNQKVKNDYPALFLYSPTLNYFFRKQLKGINLNKLNSSKDRFNKVEKWYLNEIRSWN